MHVCVTDTYDMSSASGIGPLAFDEEVHRRWVIAEERKEWKRLSHPWYLGRPSQEPSGWERLELLHSAGTPPVSVVPPRSMPLPARPIHKVKASVQAQRNVRRLMKKQPKTKKETVEHPSLKALQLRRSGQLLKWMEEC